jgi:hypothetical protein
MPATGTAPDSSPAGRRATVVLGTFGRVVGQRIELDATGRGRSVVLGVRHRRPASCTVALAVGRELERRGVPTVVGTTCAPHRPPAAQP